VSNNIGYYNRASVVINGDKLIINKDNPAVDNGELVISGFFCFSNIGRLCECLKKMNYDFLSSSELYYSSVATKVLKNDHWYDFGHLNSFFTSRTSITTEREFNSLQINNFCVIKKSKKKAKMLGEANWFLSLPPALSIFTPRVFDVREDNDYAEYTIEYLYNLPLSDMAVFCELPKSCWVNVFNSCRDFLNRSKEYSNSKKTLDMSELASYDKLYYDKTLKRLHDFELTTNIQLTKDVIFNGKRFPSIKKIAEISSRFINPTKSDDVIITHGDFCFSNILYDFRSQRIKLIDPRGINYNNELSIWGDIRYDLAKLCHSVIGCYDLIIAQKFLLEYDYVDNRIEFELYDDNYSDIVNSFLGVFNSFEEFGYTIEEIQCITIHLFLSMLPLHSDSKLRQEAFIANAYRLFSLLNLEYL
ncbi:TPA: hypothetical protein IGN79_004915, partial [Escherichia coli]|nr:hypothetical protein [Escherichia coli]